MMPGRVVQIQLMGLAINPDNLAASNYYFMYSYLLCCLSGEMENFKFKSAEELLPLVVESFSKFRNSDKRIILVIDGVNEVTYLN